MVCLGFRFLIPAKQINSTKDYFVVLGYFCCVFHEPQKHLQHKEVFAKISPQKIYFCSGELIQTNIISRYDDTFLTKTFTFDVCFVQKENDGIGNNTFGNITMKLPWYSLCSRTKVDEQSREKKYLLYLSITTRADWSIQRAVLY